MIEEEILLNSHIVYKHEEIIDAVNKIANKLNKKFSGEKVLLLPVLTGAIPFVGFLIPKLTFMMEVSYIHVSRYQNNVGQKNISFIYEPNEDVIKDQNVLVVDDILDEGITMKYIYERLNLLNPKSLNNVVLFNKKLETPKAIESNFHGLDIDDEYVFGFGLDCDGLGRNFPDLYALKMQPK